MEPLSDDSSDEENKSESAGDESLQENVFPASDAVARGVAAEEAMMEMTANGPYRVVL